MARPPATRLLAALREVCSKYGFCDVLVDKHVEQIDPRVQNAPEITDIILRAEGVERPEFYDKQMHRTIAALLDDWLFDPQGRGANSELPLTDADS